MPIGLLGIRLVLAAVFLAAAFGKRRDRAGFASTLAAFGLGAGAARVAAVVIPLIEIVVAALLVADAVAWWGAAAGLALLVVFTAAAAISLAQGRRPACACFGSAVAEPIGAATFIRNGGLAAGALVVLVLGPGAAPGSIGAAWASASRDEQFLALTSMALLAALVLTTRQASRLRSAHAALTAQIGAAGHPSRQRRDPAAAASDALPRGSEAPSFSLPLLEGDRASLEALTGAGRQVLLLFSDAQCPACLQLWPDVERWQRDHAATLTVAALCGGPSQLIEMKLMGYEVKNVLLRGEGSVSESYPLLLTPAAVVVNTAGRIDSEVAVGAPAIRSLVARLTSA